MRLIDEHLQIVMDKVQTLWEQTSQAYDRILIAFEEEDRKKALKIIRHDEKINALEEDIMDTIINVITLQAPVASDLRFLIATMKIASQLERIADYTVNIAEFVLVKEESDATIIVDSKIRNMIAITLTMLAETLEAYSHKDLKLARKVIQTDKELDKIYGQALRKLVRNSDDLTNNFDTTEINLNSILILKYLERAGDHICHIAEEIFYMVKGRFDDDYDSLE